MLSKQRLNKGYKYETHYFCSLFHEICGLGGVMLSLTIRDFVWFASLLVTLALAYGKLKSEVRHLNDVKAEKKEVQTLGNEIRQRLYEIQMTVVRIEEVIKRREKPDKKENNSS